MVDLYTEYRGRKSNGSCMRVLTDGPLSPIISLLRNKKDQAEANWQYTVAPLNFM